MCPAFDPLLERSDGEPLTPKNVAISRSVADEGIIQSTVRTFPLEDSFRLDPRTLYPASLAVTMFLPETMRRKAADWSSPRYS